MAERGAIVGVLAGLFAMVGFLMATPELSLEYTIISMLSLGLVTMILVAFGVGLGAIYGLDYENIKVKRFHDQLEQGQYLIMIDSKKEDVAEIKLLIMAHKNVAEAGEDQTFVNPFELAV